MKTAPMIFATKRDQLLLLSKCSEKSLSNLGYHRLSNIRRTLVCDKIVNHSDVVGASPVGAEFPAERPVTRKMFPFDDAPMGVNYFKTYINATPAPLLLPGIWLSVIKLLSTIAEYMRALEG